MVYKSKPKVQKACKACLWKGLVFRTVKFCPACHRKELVNAPVKE